MTIATYQNGPVITTGLTWSGGAAPIMPAASYSVPSDPVNNTSNTTQTPISYRRCALRMVFSVPQLPPIVASSKLGIYFLPLLDGVNIMTPPGNLAMPPAIGTKIYEASIRSVFSNTDLNYSVVDFGDLLRGIPLGPFSYAIQLYNGSSYAWTVAPTITLYRWNKVTA